MRLGEYLDWHHPLLCATLLESDRRPCTPADEMYADACTKLQSDSGPVPDHRDFTQSGARLSWRATSIQEDALTPFAVCRVISCAVVFALPLGFARAARRAILQINTHKGDPGLTVGILGSIVRETYRSLGSFTKTVA